MPRKWLHANLKILYIYRQPCHPILAPYYSGGRPPSLKARRKPVGQDIHGNGEYECSNPDPEPDRYFSVPFQRKPVRNAAPFNVRPFPPVAAKRTPPGEHGYPLASNATEGAFCPNKRHSRPSPRPNILP